VVGDELGAHIAAHLAAAVPARLDALALGHACVRFRRQGERPTISPEVLAGMVQMARTDYRSYARMLTHFSQGAYDDELVDRYIKRVREASRPRTSRPSWSSKRARISSLRCGASTCRFSWRNTGAVSCSPPRATRKPWRPSRKPRAPPSTSSRARARSSRRRSAPSATSCPPRGRRGVRTALRRPTVRGRLRLKRGSESNPGSTERVPNRSVRQQGSFATCASGCSRTRAGPRCGVVQGFAPMRDRIRVEGGVPLRLATRSQWTAMKEGLLW
jgi:hypothetical protein